MIIDVPIWRNADLIRIIPITRADLNQAISRNDFRPEDTPKPGKARWYSWRDVVAVAAAQDLRKLGFGPSVAFGLVQEHLSPFMQGRIDAPDDCAGVLWLIRPLRRALVQIDSTANVGRLARDLFYWSDKTRNDWCFAYYGAAAPTPQTPDILPLSASEAEE